MDNIQPYNQQDPELWDSERNGSKLAFNGRPVRIKRSDCIRILTPMFAMFPNVVMSKIAIEQYVRLLRDISPDRLQATVDAALAESEWLPTVAAIRKQYEAQCQRKFQDDTPAELDDWEERYRRIEWVVRDPFETKADRLARLRRTRRGDEI